MNLDEALDLASKILLQDAQDVDDDAHHECVAEIVSIFGKLRQDAKLHASLQRSGGKQFTLDEIGNLIAIDAEN